MIGSSSLLLYGHPTRHCLLPPCCCCCCQGMARLSQKPNQGLPEVKVLRQRVAEIRLYLPLLLWLRACAITQHPCCQHIPAGLYPHLLHCYPARLGEP